MFHCMKDDDVAADAKTYDTALFGTIVSGNVAEALNIVESAFNLNQWHGRNEYQRNQGQNRYEQHRLVGFQMSPRNFKNLWNLMREAGELEVNFLLRLTECSDSSPY